MTTMLISEARFGVNYVEQEVDIVMPGVGITACWECGGDGDWTKFHPEPHLLLEKLFCVDCKGTGQRYVDAWDIPLKSSDEGDLILAVKAVAPTEEVLS